MNDNGKTWLQKIIREPFVHFLLLGGLLYYMYVRYSKPEQETLAVTKQKEEYLIKTEEQNLGRSLSSSERKQLIDQYVDDEILLREAYKQGLDQGDPYIRKRLTDKMKFSLYDQVNSPDDDILRNYYENHKDHYAAGVRISFEQIFYDKLQYDTIRDKDKILDALNGSAEPENSGGEFPGEDKFENLSRMELIRLFGTSFATAIQKFPAGVWYGPVSSKQGVHYVRITDKQITEYLPLEVIKPAVLNDYIQEQQRSDLRHKIDSLKSGYKITIEPF